MIKIKNKYFYVILIILVIILTLRFINNSEIIKESFTPRIRQIYRPYIRQVNNKVESFVSYYNWETLKNKLKKMGIY